VDVGAKSEIHKIIRALAKDGLAVLMISSDLPEILGMSDRIAVMRGGTIAAMLPGKSDAHEVMSAALGQAGGLSEISRGLSAATPPESNHKTNRTPEGC
jgi:ABC-type multidrug transport system ATPase subunit